MSECLGFNTKQNRPCINEAVTVLIIGCVHEHIAKTRSCEEHRQQALSKKMRCQSCHQVDGHFCPIHASEEAAQ